MTLSQETSALLGKLGVSAAALSGGNLFVTSPVTGERIAALRQVTPADAGRAIEEAHAAFAKWRLVPGPRRGEQDRKSVV